MRIKQGKIKCICFSTGTMPEGVIGKKEDRFEVVYVRASSRDQKTIEHKSSSKTVYVNPRWTSECPVCCDNLGISKCETCNIDQ
ncbi:MAG: hypothetical protein QXH39_03225 [Conexivisphaerales archaeon]